MFVVITFVFQLGMFGQVLLVMGIKSAATLHHILVKVTVKAPMSFFETMDSSVLLNRFSQDMTLVDFQLPMSAFMVFLRMFSASSFLIQPLTSFQNLQTASCQLPLFLSAQATWQRRFPSQFLHCTGSSAFIYELQDNSDF
jgi:hypothetical protein